MAKDLMGELGLDVESFNKAIDQVDSRLSGLQKSVDSTDKKIKGGLVAGLKQAAQYVASAFGAAAVIRYIGSLRNLNSEIDDMRAKLLAGSGDAKDFDVAAGSSAGFRRMGKEIEMFNLKVKLGITKGIMEIGKVAEKVSDPLAEFLGIKGKSGTFAEMAKPDEAADKAKKQLLADEDAIARIQAQTLSTQSDRLSLLEEELRLQEKRIALIKSNPGLFDDPRGMMNQGLQAVGALRAEREAMLFSQTQEAKQARAISDEMQLQLRGMSGAAKEVQIRARFEKEIAKAIRDGNTDLKAQLETQQRLALLRTSVDEHNMTPRQRLSERAAARKFARDARKAAIKEGEEGDLSKRLNRMEAEGHSPTPGSELDRFRERRDKSREARMRGASTSNMSKFETSVLTLMGQIKEDLGGMNKRK